MNIIIFGASGPTGREVTGQALTQGHTVTAFVRNPAALPIQHSNLRTVRGDIRDMTAVEGAIYGQHAVLSALGVRKITKNTVLSDGTRNIIGAMMSLGVRRLVCETSLGVGDSKADLGRLFSWIFLPLMLRNAFADKEIQEQYIRESSLDWVIVRPAYLTNDPLTGNYMVWTGRKPAGVTNRISRADVAHFMLKQLVTDTYLNKTPGISY